MEFLSISKKELEENSADTGVMFCEDCRQEHKIEYSQSIDMDGAVTTDFLGTYKCKGVDYLYSIRGKRID